MSSVNPQEIPLPMAGGNTFGRYNKISDSQTWNMIVSDGALVDYAGYQNVFPSPLVANGVGRGIYSSNNGQIMIAVIGSAVYSIATDLVATPVPNGVLQTSVGDVFISENNASEIAITDSSFLYVYNYANNTFEQSIYSNVSPLPTPAPVGFFYVPFVSPGYVSFQLGRLIIADTSSQNWYLSGINAATQWDIKDVNNQAYFGALDLKPDKAQAALPFPGSGNSLVLFGRTVMESWQNVGNAIFPYQRASTFNVDYGVLNASSIAALDSYIVWLSANEQGGATLMIIKGSGAREEPISTDGIDFKLANISDPTNCTGFLMRQDGHLLYQFTFPTDNLSYVYDFNTKLFFTVSDENQNYHIARNTVFFNNDYYFVSLNDGNLYTFGTQFTNLQYYATNIQQMPRFRICPPIRLPSQRMFICKSVAFTIENGQPNVQKQAEADVFLVTQDGNFLITQNNNFLVGAETQTVYGEGTECIDLRVSRDGGETFSSALRYQMNPTGKRKSRLIFQRLGQQNDLTILIQFIGYGRFVAFDGIVEAYS
jgi:hypothetical protein